MKTIKMLVLSLTGQCNFSCVYCYASDHEPFTMEKRTALRAIDLATLSGETFILQFSGGEPLLAFDVLKEAVLYVKKNKIPARMQLQTNGSLLTEEIARFLYQNQVGIGISLDGRAPVNDRMRLLKDGRGATGAILEGAALLKYLGIEAGITCVVTKENVGALPGIVEMAYYMGNIRKIGFDLLRGQGRGGMLEAPCGTEVEAAIDETYQAAEKFARLTGTAMQFTQIERVETLRRGGSSCFGHCYAMNGEAAFVDATGDIYACSSLIGKSDFYLGNVGNGIDEERRERVGKTIERSMHFCFACRDFGLCGGGCFARWYGSGCKTEYPGECALKRTSIAWAWAQKNTVSNAP